MNATTTAEAAVLDLEPIERTAQPLAVQGTGAIAANSPAAMMMQAMSQGIVGKRLDQLLARIKKTFDIPEWFSYDPESGLVTWRKSPSKKIRAGNAAGTPCGKGSKKYLNIKFDGGYILAHHVAFFLYFGRLPICELDHIDGNGLNNRLPNFRETTHASNMKNVKLSSRNTSGVMGVHYSRKTGKWEASICVDGKRIFLGSFSSTEKAAMERKNAEARYGFHKNHGKRHD